MAGRHFSAAVIGVAAFSLVLSGCARGGGAGGSDAEGDHYTIKFAHVVTVTTPKGQAAEKFKELVEAKSNGRITVEVYPNSELYGDEDELQALQSGAVQVLAPSTAKFTTIAPQLQVLDLPFLFESPDQISEVIAPDTSVGKAIYENEDLAERNIQVLGLWDNGFKQLSANTPITGPADLNGLRFRIQPSDVLRSQFEAWGVRPTPMAFGEVYNALQQGVIDGAENPWSNIETQKMHTVQKYIVESNHGYLGYVLVINKDFLSSLPADLQAAVTEAADEATAFIRQIAADVNAKSKQAIIDAKTSQVTELTGAQRQALKDVVVPSVWNQYADAIGRELVDELLENNG
ncbi:MAG TPA: DctP family TRAP transporter solute-binding subunit [Jiangellales bacterium]|nr:DctP family TRAP transporter solute-binding subunit [Jiangellales bacterium]